jgi:hypothetical protein
MSEASIRTQWKKGQSGNPKGRPKKPKNLWDQGETCTNLARLLLNQPCYREDGSQITRLTRFMLDVQERAELGELGCIKFLVEMADRGDRRELQAQRAARRAKKPEDAQFERRNALAIKLPAPPLRPDQHHAIAPMREVRTAHLKPKPPAPAPRYAVNPYSRERDPFAHISKHRVPDGCDRYTPYPEYVRSPASDAMSPAKTGDATGPRTGDITGGIAGLKTGAISGPTTGLEEAARSDQAFDANAKSDFGAWRRKFSNMLRLGDSIASTMTAAGIRASLVGPRSRGQGEDPFPCPAGAAFAGVRGGGTIREFTSPQASASPQPDGVIQIGASS